MTIRKLLLITLILVAVASVMITSMTLGFLTDDYFNDYQENNYERHIDQIVNYTSQVLKEDNLSISQMEIELETHLDDPITQIKLYDANGDLIVDVKGDTQTTMGNMMRGNMMGGGPMKNGTRPKMQPSYQEVDNIQLELDGEIVGQLNITRYSSIRNSVVSQMFKSNLIANSIYSTIAVLIISLVVGIIVSKRMSKSLISTAKMAQNINLGEQELVIDSKIREIQTIQDNLIELKNRLKLKTKSRKVLVDELVHQTRTPLTVLKTHLEGYSDGIIDLSEKEIETCENQISNITSIISNMSNMIDAQKEFEEINIQEFKLPEMINQIVSGLHMQFEKKNISLEVLSDEDIIVVSDKYKISQSVYNIITNAYKYTKEQGDVSINYYVDADDMVFIEVSDNGIGINDADKEKIFEAYFRGSDTVKIQGEGLGLYFAHENIEKVGGEIDVVSSLGQGSKFILSFPKQAKVDGDIDEQEE